MLHVGQLIFCNFHVNLVLPSVRGGGGDREVSKGTLLYKLCIPLSLSLGVVDVKQVAFGCTKTLQPELAPSRQSGAKYSEKIRQMGIFRHRLVAIERKPCATRFVQEPSSVFYCCCSTVKASRRRRRLLRRWRGRWRTNSLSLFRGSHAFWRPTKAEAEENVSCDKDPKSARR